MERISCRRKQLLSVLTVGGARAHRGDRDCRARTHFAVYPLGRSGTARCCILVWLFSVSPLGRSGTARCCILDWLVAVCVCRGLPRFRLGAGLSIDGPNHVPATL